MAKKPTLKAGPASKYESPNEIIREFGANNGTGDGGLIALRVLEDGTLVVDIYQVSGKVKINVPDQS